MVIQNNQRLKQKKYIVESIHDIYITYSFMSPTIVHKQFGKKDSDESKAAERLRGILSKIDADGSILIISNLSLPGGELIKDIDIVVLGFLRDYIIYPYHHPSNRDVNTLKVNSFCITIELKGHCLDDVDINQLGGVFVTYNGKKKHDVVDQSRKQRDALRNVLKRTVSIEPKVTNLIWLEIVEEALVNHDKSGWNILFKDFNAEKFFITAANYNSANIDKCHSNENVLYSFNGKYLNKELSRAFELFLQSTKPNDNLSREKFEFITNRNQPVDVINNGQLNVLSGRAGTGKTIQLIKFAYNEVVENHKRCILLTYNHALVSDIRRIAYYCDFPSGTEEAFCVRTIHSFFIELLELNKLCTVFSDTSFETEYLSRLTELYQHKTIDTACAWDYVLIDEAQDCKNEEINLWKRLFSESQIVIADGVDQFIRGETAPSWNQVSSFGQITTHKLTVSKRQKNHIVSFVNAFAQYAGISWHVEENRDLAGGKVIITNQFDKDLYDDLKEKLTKSGNIMYDMLFLVDSIMGSDKYLPEVINKLQDFGIRIFNGAQYDNRTKYSINPDECRLYNYNSCRGIEGWTVVCLNFDMLMKEKLKYAPYLSRFEFESDFSYQERLQREVYKWMLMPLTRAIDTLVISLYDTNSPIGQLMYKLHKERPDYVIWDIRK